MTSVLKRKGRVYAGMKTEVEILVINLQAEKHQGLPAARQREAQRNFLQNVINPTNILALNFKGPKL